MAKAKEVGFQYGQEERTTFFNELLGMLAPVDFQQEGFFQALIRYVKDCRHTIEVGQDLEEAVFPYDVSDDDPDNPKSSIPLDGCSEEGR